MDVMLDSSQVDDSPPICPVCSGQTAQEFRAPAIIGHTPRSKAEAIKDDILSNDYAVADTTRDKYSLTPKTRYKDQTSAIPQSTWTAATETIQQAIAAGRETRLRHGSGLDILQNNLKNGTEVDLIAQSKKRAIKVW